MDEEQYLTGWHRFRGKQRGLLTAVSKYWIILSKTKKFIVLSLPTSIIGERRNVLKKTPKCISVKRKMVRKSLQKGHTSILRRHRHLLSKWN